MHIKKSSKATVFVHRDRDYLDTTEIDQWKKEIHAINAEPFITKEMDIEGYFCVDKIIDEIMPGRLDEIKNLIVEGETDDIITSYVNGRIDYARKSGTIGKLDIGKLSAEAAKKIQKEPILFMKGKRKLSRLKYVLKEKFGVKFDINTGHHSPLDEDLAKAAARFFKKKI